MAETKKYALRLRGKRIPVTKEVFYAYHRSKRRERYFERDIKTETPIYDGSGEVVGYKPAKEDSLDRLWELGEEFVDDCGSVEETVIDAMMAEQAKAAVKLLPDDERELIEALYYSNEGQGMPEREYAAAMGIPQKTINDRKARILAKIKNFMEN